MGVRLKLDHTAVARVVGGMSRSAAERAANRLQERARVNIAAAGRVDTGEMMRKVVVRPVPSPPMQPRFRVSAETKQAVFNEFGTRDYVSPPGHVMRFKPKGSGVFIFRTRRRGITAIHFMARARALASPFDFGL